jgi:hypothetical protein
MRNTILALSLAVTLFCGAVIADDGNMGNGGYTGCDGSNPPPTCDCNVPNPPESCNTGGFATVQGTDSSTEAVDYTLATEIVIDSLMAAF